MIVIGIFALAVGLAQQAADTTFAVRPGGRLDLDMLNGTVSIRTWDNASMRIEAAHSRPMRLSVRRRADAVRVEAENRNGGPASGVRFVITVPRSFNINVDGVDVATTVDGLRGNISIDNVEGTIAIHNINGNVDVESVSGSIVVENVTGNVRASTVNQGIRMNGVRGNVDADAVQGSIIMQRVDAARVEASTVNGFIEYHGSIRDGGRYYLGAHNGQVIMAVPEQANASMTIRAHNGSIESAFALPVRSMRDRRVAFTLGNGSARVEVESHNGNIRLIRPR